ncbi:Abi-domain-containing protein [Obba rivulosa]|uniref:intramembrane prenyl-peptidase Rce1 n=1 Tax=Obba rivulosa TaxID=1052685 RepID=A0A8E2DG11_9APHY|nr:Abi-domain-containing protein [Obba rivulosa]
MPTYVAFEHPPLPLPLAHAFAAFFALSYVGSIYVSKNARVSPNNGQPAPARARAKDPEERWRNDPGVIRARLLAVSLSTLASCVAVLMLMWVTGGAKKELFHEALISTITRLGLAHAPLLPCLVTPLLYLGPLYFEFLVGRLPLQRHWNIKLDLFPVVATWQGWRNYIIAPLTEEIVFRGCTLAVYHFAGLSRTKMIFLTPLTFGAAHVHHAWETYNRLGRTASAAKFATIQTLAQLAYTSLFGFHCAFLFMRTGSLLPAISSHIFCNIMGLPAFGMHIRQLPSWRIVLAYILGIVGYVYTMDRWTKTQSSLYWVHSGDRPIY